MLSPGATDRDHQLDFPLAGIIRNGKFQELLKLLDGREKDERVDAVRLQEVRARIDQAIKGLN